MEGLDNLIGVIIFLVVGGLSLISQILAKRKEEERRLNQPPRKDPSELPEQLRRMLYGDAPNIPTARPRTSETPGSGAPPYARPAGPPPLARPARTTVITFDDEGTGTDEDAMPSLEENTARRQAQEAQAQAQRERELQARIEQQRLQQEAMRRRAEELRHQQAQAAQNRAGQAGRPEFQPPVAAARGARAERAAAPARTRGQVSAPEASTPQPQGLLSLRAVRQGIILAEILGPPRGLQPY